MKWVTTDSLGEIAFCTQRECKMRYPDHIPTPCDLPLGFKGWLAMAPASTENNGTIRTPGGKDIPVVWGWAAAAGGKLIGFRGGTCDGPLWPYWRAIMTRAIDATLAVQNHKQNPL